jgi:hypothetical protein
MSNTYFHNDCTSRKACFYSFILIFAMIMVPATLLAANSNIPKTGQTIRYTSEDDGDLENGVSWPSPRFSDNENGSITDTLTNLVWLKDENCFSGTWNSALNYALALENGDCSLLDDSSLGDWRVPNVRELESLLHMGVSSPTVPNTNGSGKATSGNPFDSSPSGNYWTSTTDTLDTLNALIVDMDFGRIESDAKTLTLTTIFVRDSSKSGSSPVAQVFATGQVDCYDDLGAEKNCALIFQGQDGKLQKGMQLPSSSPRFSNTGDGTVNDNLTGLTWLKTANCSGLFTSWSTAISITNTLADGICGLQDDSIAGDWRIPNRRELMSLIDYNFYSPALSNSVGTERWRNGDPFIGVQTTFYWGSTTASGFTGSAWYFDLNTGLANNQVKQNYAYIWPIRNNLLSSLSVSIQGDGTGKVTSSPAGISCPGQCTNQFPRFSSVLLTAQADSGFRFDGWSIGSCGKSMTCRVNMSASQSVTATFSESSTAVSSWLLLLLGE